MKTAFFTSTLALVSLAFAWPTSSLSSSANKCISEQEGTQWLQEFIGVLGKTDPHWQATADKILAADFVEYSNSRQSIQGLPVSSPAHVSEPSKKAWIAAIVQAKEMTGIKTFETIITCKKIVWRWTFTDLGTAKYPVAGFNLFHMKYNATGQLQVETLYPEFDSIAYGLDTGLKVTYPNGTVLPSS